jgi:HlyD family secretion protein
MVNNRALAPASDHRLKPSKFRLRSARLQPRSADFRVPESLRLFFANLQKNRRPRRLGVCVTGSWILAFLANFSDLFGRVPDTGQRTGKGLKGRPNPAQANGLGWDSAPRRGFTHFRRPRSLAGGSPRCATSLLGGLIVALSLVWSGCSSHQAAQPVPVVTVQVATVRQKTVQRVVAADALLYPLAQTVIDPKISAPIRKFYVQRGSAVHAGELLAALENEDLAAAVVEAQGAYEQAQANYATSTKLSLPAAIQKARLDVQATRQAMESDALVYQSRLKLYKAGAISRNLMDQAHVTYVTSRNQYQIAVAYLKGLDAVGKSEQMKLAEGELATAKGQYLAAEAQYNYSLIHSPISGVVTSRPLYEGQMASAGSPLMTVMNISHVVARAHISPEQASLLRVGDPATISLGGGEADVRGKVSIVSPALDPNSTTVQVWVDAANPGGHLKPGSTVQVKMVAETVKNALVIPASAVLTASDGSTSVMVVGADNVAHQTTVKTGVHESNEVQILSGLELGERVVTEGAYGLPDGTKVKYSGE